MKKLILFLVILILMLGTLTNIYASQSSVNVSLPSFKITLNGTQIDNVYREYPFITYKGITYFPLTYFDCRFLGTETVWNQSTGLEVNKTGVTCGYRNYTTKVKNKNTYTATIPNFSIKINGKTIDNTKEEYPLLLFKNVTYFPMTWRFCVNEFGWSYKFDSINGLSINSTNPTTSNILSSKFYGNVINKGFLLDDKSCYYFGEDGEIFKISYNKNAKPEKIFQLPTGVEGAGGIYGWAWFYEDNNMPYFAYHHGGGIMGSDYYFQINDDGTLNELELGYLVKNFGDYYITLDKGGHPPMSPDNMYIQTKDSEFKKLGDPKYYYAAGHSYSEINPSNGLYMIDDYVYAIGSVGDIEKRNPKIVRVNIHNNETVEIGSTDTKYFVIDNSIIYRVDTLSKLYKMNLEIYDEVQIDIPKNKSVEVLNDKIFYWNEKDNKLYLYGQDKAINENGTLISMEIDDNYLICKFEEASKNPYRLLVIDKNGDIVLKSSDVSNHTSISNDVLTYMEFYSKDIYKVNLK
ncbi:MAG TPA: hypothetical protein DC000_06790 [Clostridiales bacterium]|nr:hypothetical protein [Clostridiales bacterium]